MSFENTRPKIKTVGYVLLPTDPDKEKPITSLSLKDLYIKHKTKLPILDVNKLKTNSLKCMQIKPTTEENKPTVKKQGSPVQAFIQNNAKFKKTSTEGADAVLMTSLNVVQKMMKGCDETRNFYIYPPLKGNKYTIVNAKAQTSDFSSWNYSSLGHQIENYLTNKNENSWTLFKIMQIVIPFSRSNRECRLIYCAEIDAVSILNKGAELSRLKFGTVEIKTFKMIEDRDSKVEYDRCREALLQCALGNTKQLVCGLYTNNSITFKTFDVENILLTHQENWEIEYNHLDQFASSFLSDLDTGKLGPLFGRYKYSFKGCCENQRLSFLNQLSDETENKCKQCGAFYKRKLNTCPNTSCQMQVLTMSNNYNRKRIST